MPTPPLTEQLETAIQQVESGDLSMDLLEAMVTQGNLLIVRNGGRTAVVDLIERAEDPTKLRICYGEGEKDSRITSLRRRLTVACRPHAASHRPPRPQTLRS